ncbi:hypothetical protein DSL72_007986 [Monilinia vaccinii-corymbosi]|uniref:Alcohol acetyltransferase n=1 Tax=Monilinia vaccinii-corymbosi TaxID=61207 RepID=A0A8A3PJH0_9HELO|nr:hypothetical protein DSL72_007986 [Monilinia vaccinii-corymbosi]
MEDDTFPAGLLGNHYSARHECGLYRSCAVNSYYTFTPTLSHALDEFTQRLSRALAKTIERHPSLCYGLLPGSQATRPKARFKRISRISWDDVVTIASSSEFADGQAQEARVCEEIGSAHEQLFDDPEHRPVWRVRVLMYGAAGDGTYRVYILFMAHHAIADGLSCASFQRTLHEQLCLAAVETGEKSDVQWPYSVPQTVGRPIALEDAMDISTPGCEALSPQPVSGEKKTRVWTGNRPSLPTIESYRSLALLVTVPPGQVPRIVETCRRLKITVTGYLHGLIVSCLARSAVTDGQLSIRAGTPYSLRKFTQLPMVEMANHISSMSIEWNAELLNSMCHAAEGSLEEEKLIAAIGRQLTEELSAEIAKIAVEGVCHLRMVDRITDLKAYSREALSRERWETYEISNLGVVRMNPVPEQSAFTLEGLIFSQCGMILGAPIGCNVANLEGGPLVISLTWQKGGVDDEIVVGLQEFLGRRLGASSID